MDKYEEALEKARAGKSLEEIFPEMKESEDERMVRIIENVICTNEGEVIAQRYGLKLIDLADWLEKQKDVESKYAGMVVVSQEEWDTAIADAFKHGMDEGEKQKEQEEDLSTNLNGLMQEYIKSGKDEEEQEHRLKCYKLFWDALEDSEFFKQFKQKEQKSAECIEDSVKFEEGFKTGRALGRREGVETVKTAEWIEEDEKLLDFWLDVIDRNDWRMDEDFCKASREFINRLKSLPLNLKKKNEDAAKLCSNEWSEEDEKMRLEAIKRIDELEFLGIPCNNVRNVLESIRPSWKPSEEQMEALKRASMNEYLSAK